MGGGRRGRLLASVAPVHQGDLDGSTGGGLNRRGEPLDLGTVLRGRRRHMRRQEVAQRVKGEAREPDLVLKAQHPARTASGRADQPPVAAAFFFARRRGRGW